MSITLALEQQSDTLLRKNHAGSGEYPAHSEYYLFKTRDRRREEIAPTDPFDDDLHMPVEAQYQLLDARDVAYLMRKAGLSKRERSVVRGRLDGRKWSYIARGLHCSEKQARKALERGIKKLQKRTAWEPFLMLVGMLSEVFGRMPYWEVRWILKQTRRRRPMCAPTQPTPTARPSPRRRPGQPPRHRRSTAIPGGDSCPGLHVAAPAAP